MATCAELSMAQSEWEGFKGPTMKMPRLQQKKRVCGVVTGGVKPDSRSAPHPYPLKPFSFIPDAHIASYRPAPVLPLYTLPPPLSCPRARFVVSWQPKPRSFGVAIALEFDHSKCRMEPPYLKRNRIGCEFLRP